MMKSWTLLDLAVDPAADRYAEGQVITPEQLGLVGCTVRQQTLHGGLRDRVELLWIDNGGFRVAVLPHAGWGCGKPGWAIYPWVGIRPCAARCIRASFSSANPVASAGWTVSTNCSAAADYGAMDRRSTTCAA